MRVREKERVWTSSNTMAIRPIFFFFCMYLLPLSLVVFGRNPPLVTTFALREVATKITLGKYQVGKCQEVKKCTQLIMTGKKMSRPHATNNDW